MKNWNRLIIVLLVLIFTFAGCQKPIDAYKKTVNDLSLPSKLKDIKATGRDIITQTDKLISQDIIEQQSYDDLSNKIIDYKNNITDLQTQIDNINHSDEDITNTHNMLVSALEGYIQIGDQAQNVLTLDKSLDDDYKKVGDTNQELMDIALSGNPTSLEYNQELNDFMNNNIDDLKLFDLETAKELLSAKDIDIDYINSFISKSGDLFTQFQGIKTYNDTDERVKNLLIQMYEQILDMYNIVINNKDLIEWSNSYSTFSEGVNEDVKENEDNITNWASNVGIQLE